MVRSDTLAAAASLLLLPAAANGMYSKSSPVLQVDARSYDNLIAKSNHTSIVEFYAPWCGHCKNLKPAYEKVGTSLKGLAKVAAVDCDEESNKPFCGSMGVQGFPTLKIVRPGKKPGKPIVEDYQGARSAKAIVDAVIEKIPNHVKRLKDSDYAAWVEEDGPKAILFTDKGTVSALLKSVAIDFLGSINVAQIRNKEAEAVEAFGVEDFPTLVLLPGGGKDPVTFDGELKKDAIVKFLSQVAAPNPDPAPKADKKKGSKSDKSKSSSASSKLSKSSASQASEEAETKAPSQTAETIIDDPTDSPNPQVDTEKPAKVADTPAKPISSLQDGLSLQQRCLNDKAGTCVLALLPEPVAPSMDTINTVRFLSEVHKKHETAKRNLFPFFQVPHTNSQGASLVKKLDLKADEPEIIAVNGKRGWWRHFKGEKLLAQIEDWVDAIRMGDGAKQSLPNGLIMPAADLPQEPVKLDGSADLNALRDSLKGQLPEGMEYMLEELSDEDYERLMKQGEEAGSGPIDHDEL